MPGRRWRRRLERWLSGALCVLLLLDSSPARAGAAPTTEQSWPRADSIGSAAPDRRDAPSAPGPPLASGLSKPGAGIGQSVAAAAAPPSPPALPSRHYGLVTL